MLRRDEGSISESAEIVGSNPHSSGHSHRQGQGTTEPFREAGPDHPRGHGSMGDSTRHRRVYHQAYPRGRNMNVDPGGLGHSSGSTPSRTDPAVASQSPGFDPGRTQQGPRNSLISERTADSRRESTPHVPSGDLSHNVRIRQLNPPRSQGVGNRSALQDSTRTRSYDGGRALVHPSATLGQPRHPSRSSDGQPATSDAHSLIRLVQSRCNSGVTSVDQGQHPFSRPHPSDTATGTLLASRLESEVHTPWTERDRNKRAVQNKSTDLGAWSSRHVHDSPRSALEHCPDTSDAPCSSSSLRPLSSARSGRRRPTSSRGASDSARTGVIVDARVERSMTSSRKPTGVSARTPSGSSVTSSNNEPSTVCSICTNGVEVRQAVWNCSKCFTTFHLSCVNLWMQTSSRNGDEFWSCPICRGSHEFKKLTYTCFCGKQRNPGLNNLRPHACRSVCGRPSPCGHDCTAICHPGRCPPCSYFGPKSCHCGSTSKITNCLTNFTCNGICPRTLSCGRHPCGRLCHQGPCGPCTQTAAVSCFCTKTSLEGPCESTKTFSCGSICSKTLTCGNHTCQLTCHDDSCESCPTTVNETTTCHCGKKQVGLLMVRARRSCLDPIPSCRQVCGKLLSCGKQTHRCTALCHPGACEVCTRLTEVTCRCGRVTSTVPCTPVGSDRLPLPLCSKKCNRNKTCGRHRCTSLCCDGSDHTCLLTCGRLLACGLHSCADLCHSGACRSCVEYIHDQLSCACGNITLEPPVRCGVLLPPCLEQCRVLRPCGHPTNHLCHTDSPCPPCTESVLKQCPRGHKAIGFIPCHVEYVCGEVCRRRLKCGFHECPTHCHTGDCPEVCPLLCGIQRRCGHPCQEICHPESSCDSLPPCSASVLVPCQCGHTAKVIQCYNATTVDEASHEPRGSLFSECTKECLAYHRRRRLAEGFGVDDQDLVSAATDVPFSVALLADARADPQFFEKAEGILLKLVRMPHGQKLHRESIMVMSLEKSRALQELACHYHCDSKVWTEKAPHSVEVICRLDSRPPVQSLTFVVKNLPNRGDRP